MTQSTDKGTVTIKVAEIVAADVSYISLVPRGANRLPFRVTKSDTDEDKTMPFGIPDFLFAKKKKAETAPAVSSITIRTEDAASINPQLVAAGFRIDDAMQIDDTTVYKQDGFDPDAVQSIAFSPDVVATIRTTKSFDSYPETSVFGETLAVAGLFPSVYLATDALVATIRNAMYSTESPVEAAALIATALDDFKAYTVSLVIALPVMAFKLDGIVAKEDQTNATTEAVEEEATVADPVVLPTTSEGTEVLSEVQVEAVSTTTKSDDAVVTALNTLTALVTSMKVDVAAVVASNAALNVRVAKSDSALNALQAKVSGTAITHAQTEDAKPLPTLKADGNADPEWDSAFTL